MKNSEKHKEPLRKRFKKLTKKKSFRIIFIAALLFLVTSIIITVIQINKGKKAFTVATTVQTTTAETGSISSTVEGTGSLSSAETANIMIPSGVTIDEILVSSGDLVTKGQAIATVDKTSVISAMLDVEDALDNIDDDLDSSSLSDLEEEMLTAKRKEAAAVLDTLTTMYNTLTLTSTVDGTISSLNLSSGSSDNTSTSSPTEVSSTSISGDSGFVTMSTNSMTLLTASDSLATTSSNLTPITDYKTLAIATPTSGMEPQQAITEADYYTGTITWNCSGKTFQAGTEYTATIVLTAKKSSETTDGTGYTFDSNNLPVIAGSTYDCHIINEGAEGNKLRIEATFEATVSSANSDDKNNAASDSSTNTNTDVSSATSNSDTLSSNVSSSGSSVSSSSSSSSSNTNSSYESVAATVALNDNLLVSISIDELDILSVELGQTATITLDALESKEFTGTITRVASSTTSSNGSSKYTVEITIPKEDNMLIGMSASAVINISEAENAVLIPINALQESGDKTFVYTEKDSEGNLSGEVELETGLSNGSQVEITSGLSNGDAVYYLKTTSDNEDSAMPFGNMDNNYMPGDMPSGDMPNNSGNNGISGDGIGLIFGLYPAHKAASKKPIDALRFI